MKKLLLILCLFTVKSIISQNGFATYTATIPGSGTVGSETALLIDNLGNKWIGFGNPSSGSAAAIGVYSVSSSSWIYFNKTNTPTLPSNLIRCLAKDNAGNIWIGTAAGLVQYNAGVFTAYTTANGLPANNIISLESINNMLYIGTASGMSRYDGISFTNYNTTNALLPFNNITAIKAETANDIWLGTTNNLIKFYIDPTFTSTSYTVLTPSFGIGTINAIHIDGIGYKWLATSTLSIVRYDNANFDMASTLYPNILSWPFAPMDVGRGPNNGVAFLTTLNGTVAAGPTKGIVELFSAGNYSLYSPPTAAYNFLRYFDTDPSGNLFMVNYPTMSAGVNLPMMYSFGAASYTPQPSYVVTGSNYKYLDINRVKAGILNRGDMFWDLGGTSNASYEVPQGSGVHGGFAAGLWLGGLDASNQLHTAAQTYRQNGNDFWPGPLDTISGNADAASFVAYDKIWKVDYNDINAFIINWNNGNIAANTYTPVADILSWPAHGTGNKTKNMAPFVDSNGDGLYNPYNGDYPDIKGDQALYFIYNDNYTTHTETGGAPFGVEVHCMAYAYGCPTVINGKNELAYTTFYNYKVYNRSNNNYHDVYAGFWTDVDIGCYLNDYIGSSYNESLGFAYNSSGVDASCSGATGYGNYPPAAGTSVLKGPLAPASDGIDNDHDGTTDEAGEECLMNIFDFYNNNIGSFPPQTTNPNTFYHYYNYLLGKWKDSTDFTCGANAYGGATPTKFVFPQSNYTGNPCGTWTEITAGNLAGDRRYIISSGPFNLPAKSMIETEYAYVWSVDSSAAGQNIGAVNKLITDAQKVRTFYSGPKSDCLLSIVLDAKDIKVEQTNFTMFPNPTSNAITIHCKKEMESVEVLDMLGRTVRSLQPRNTEANINVQGLANGVYFVNVSGEGFKSTKKLVKN